MGLGSVGGQGFFCLCPSCLWALPYPPRAPLLSLRGTVLPSQTLGLFSVTRTQNLVSSPYGAKMEEKKGFKRSRDVFEPARRFVRKIPIFGEYFSPYLNWNNIKHLAEREHPMAFGFAKRRRRVVKRGGARYPRGRARRYRRRRIYRGRRRSTVYTRHHHRRYNIRRFRRRARRRIHEKRVTFNDGAISCTSPLDTSNLFTNWHECFPMYGKTPVRGTSTEDRIGNDFYVHGEQIRGVFRPAEYSVPPDMDCKIRMIVIWVYGEGSRGRGVQSFYRDDFLEPPSTVYGTPPFDSTVNDFWRHKRDPETVQFPPMPNCDFRVLVDKTMHLRSYANQDYAPPAVTIHLPPRTVGFLNSDNSADNFPTQKGRLLWRFEQYGGDTTNASQAYHPSPNDDSSRWEFIWKSRTIWSDPS